MKSTEGSGGSRGDASASEQRLACRAVTRVAVVGHVEWVEFVRIDHFPTRGAIAHARDASIRAAGGGVVAAVVLARLGAKVDFFCALGDDANGAAAASE